VAVIHVEMRTAEPGRYPTKTVSVESAYYPNLVSHAFAVMGFRNSRDDYDLRLSDVRRAFQSRFRDLLDIGADMGFKPPVAGGPLFTFVYQLPADVGVRTCEEIAGVFEAEAEALTRGRFEPLYTRYPERKRGWEAFFCGPWQQYVLSEPVLGKHRVLGLFADFLLSLAQDHFDAWWPAWDASLCRRAGRLTGALERLSLIEAWETRLGMPYRYAGFRVLLSIPDKTGASSVGPEAIVVGDKWSDDDIVAAALHEVGVRMFDFTEIPRRKGADLTLSQHEHMLRCIEAATCSEKAHVAQALGLSRLVQDDLFLKSMRLETMVDRWAVAHGSDPADRLEWLYDQTVEASERT
jgi:hypothetical protein